jgi:DNA polymerase III epsilon subunit-like protein
MWTRAAGASSSSAPLSPVEDSAAPSSASAFSYTARLASAIATIRGPFPTRPLAGDEKRYIALDCEMVGVGADGVRSSLAQVVAVDWLGRVVYLSYVSPKEPVTDYRTHVSGVRPEHLRGAPSFERVQAEVASLVRGKVVVGHSLVNDMKALLLSHPWHATRDTAKFKPFMWKAKGGMWKPKRLKHLVEQHIREVEIQTGEHDPAEDARAALALYKIYRPVWEKEMAKKEGGGGGGGTSGGTSGGGGGKRQRT